MRVTRIFILVAVLSEASYIASILIANASNFLSRFCKLPFLEAVKRSASSSFNKVPVTAGGWLVGDTVLLEEDTPVEF